MMKFFGGLIGFLLLLYIVVCLIFYFLQERFIFFPQKLPADTSFSYPYEFEEIFIEVEKGVKLNGLLFKAAYEKSQKGVIFYLHGNAGALDSWGYAADEFLQEGYDVFIPDYRGYGKSEGKISSQDQLFQDMKEVYLYIKKLYPQQEIIITGFSIGSGPACWLASRYHPDLLILIAPFYNMEELAGHYFPFLPTFILRYPFKNNQYLLNVRTPVVLIHGKEDNIIPYETVIKLKGELGAAVRLFTLEGLGHNNISGSPQFRKIISTILK